MKTKKFTTKFTAVLMAVLMIALTVPVAFAADNESVTIVLADPENDPPVASEIEPGSQLFKSQITGGTLKVLETGEILTDIVWFWENESVFVNSPGMYTAIGLSFTYPEIGLYMDVYVGFVGGLKETEITVVPEIPELCYDGITTWKDIKLEGGVAVEKGTDNIIEGTFSIANSTGMVSSSVMKAGSYDNYFIKFTPNDTEKYSPSLYPVSVTVNKGTPSWKNGETPVVTVPYGTTVVDETFHNFRYDGTLVADETLQLSIYDSEGNKIERGVFLDCGTYNEYQLRAYSLSTQSNWQATFLPVTIIVEPGEAEITVSYNSITNKLTVSATSRYLYGTFDIYIDGVLAFDDAPIERYQDTQRYVTDWKPADISGNSTHDIKVVYNKADNDNASVSEDFEGSFTFEARRNITEGEKSISFYKKTSVFEPGKDDLFAGQEITAQAGAPDFRYWKITDAEGNDVELEFISGDMNSQKIIFVMPEFDINIDYVCQFEIDRQEAIDNCDCLCHSDNPIVQFFWRIILFFMNLFKVENVCDCGYPHGS